MSDGGQRSDPHGHASDFDEWESLGARNWGYAYCLPYFQRAAAWKDGSDAYRDAQGLLATNAGNEMKKKPLHRAFVNASHKAGYITTEDPNGFMREGFGPIHMTVNDGVRWSTADAYLKPAMSQPNPTVITHAMTHRVLLDRKRAVGVGYDLQGQTHTALALALRRFCRRRVCRCAARPARRGRKSASPFRGVCPIRLQAAYQPERQDGTVGPFPDPCRMGAVQTRPVDIAPLCKRWLDPVGSLACLTRHSVPFPARSDAL